MPTCSSASPKNRTLLAFRLNQGIAASFSLSLSGPPGSGPLKDQQALSASFSLLLSYRLLQTTRFRSIKGPTLLKARRPQTSERARKPPHNEAGQEKREKATRMGPVPQRGSREGGKLPPARDVLLLAGRSAWMKGELWSLGGEHCETVKTSTMTGALN